MAWQEVRRSTNEKNETETTLLMSSRRGYKFDVSQCRNIMTSELIED